ncbi:oligopeptide transport system permease protein [Breznakia sp. PF5-3]|uniref:ABC transporter permease n=1 Tax=unclassified Breznakia TaxID=2623764 RepID=UPI002406074D|nr:MULTISPECIES: ABC transporter permease [unclassified Breznakia]MDF9824590.1 oligopeptide transport system permease protein [Breznakia sp. PM6-1]MDF9835480.1 oligopeptide transport system permease protein [Breznakia sp. PF5-3]MDF9837890.1 oligopeptide transport system permease protein [Breznakia sp. PFB2-8]MDF9859817.1 oligopeptide transport system permease protein [Breznakia sp. PH5-24]
MAKYITKRVLIGILTLFVLTTATFFLAKATPGSPFSAERYRNEEAREKAMAKYNLDKPVMEQYFLYLQGITEGDLGESYIQQGRTVNYYIEEGFPVTARLGSIAFIIALIAGIGIGTGAALSKKRWINNVCMFIATIGVSIPSFLIALLLQLFIGVQLGLLPFIGLYGPEYYIMPAFSLALYPIAMIARLTRSSLLEVMRQDYIVLARSKGTPYRMVVLRHALKNAMLPVITYAGPMFAFLLTGSFVVETIYSIPGIGATFVQCVVNRDYPLIMGMTIFLGFIIITFNILTDLISAAVDPRIKLK